MAQEKSRVNRFGIAGNYAPKNYGARKSEVERHFLDLDNNFITSATQQYMKHSSRSKIGKIALPSSGSYCSAYSNYTGNNSYSWFSKAGCIAAINSFGATSVSKIYPEDLYFYIPNVLPLSKGKKIKYIEELGEVLGKDRIQYIRTVDPSKGLVAPDDSNPDTVHSVLSGVAGGTSPYPYVWIQCKEWLVVKCVVKSTWERLMFLQFLRPLYQLVSVDSFIRTHNRVIKTQYDNRISPEGRLYFMYNQPQLYFRLKRLFPTLGRTQLLYLSHTMHGQTISSTYFVWYIWNGFYRCKVDIDSETALKTPTNGINNYFMGDGLHTTLQGVVESRGADIRLNDGTTAYKELDPTIDPKTLNVIKAPVGGTVIMQIISAYLAENFLAKRYKNCINMLAVLSKDDKLLID